MVLTWERECEDYRAAHSELSKDQHLTVNLVHMTDCFTGTTHCYIWISVTESGLGQRATDLVTHFISYFTLTPTYICAAVDTAELGNTFYHSISHWLWYTHIPVLFGSIPIWYPLSIAGETFDLIGFDCKCIETRMIQHWIVTFHVNTFRDLTIQFKCLSVQSLE